MRFPRDLFLGALAPLVVLVAGMHKCCLVTTVSISLITAAMGIATALWLNYRLGGHTGDTYGAVVELAETGGLLIFTLAACSVGT